MCESSQCTAKKGNLSRIRSEFLLQNYFQGSELLPGVEEQQVTEKEDKIGKEKHTKHKRTAIRLGQCWSKRMYQILIKRHVIKVAGVYGQKVAN